MQLSELSTDTIYARIIATRDVLEEMIPLLNELKRRADMNGHMRDIYKHPYRRPGRDHRRGDGRKPEFTAR